MRYSALYQCPRFAVRLATLGVVVAGCVSRPVVDRDEERRSGENRSSRVATSGRPVRVLFIGNSYTYFNNLPEVLEAIAREAGMDIDAAMHARGGATLRDHLADGALLDRLHNAEWDHVVIQEQSTLGLRQIEGLPTVADPEFFLHHARLLSAEVRALGAAPLFLLTWRRRDAPTDDQDRLTHAYVTAASRSGAGLVPAGLAWERARRQRPDLDLHTTDGSHPSPAGTYLTAHAILAVIAGQSTGSGPARIVGHPVTVTGQLADTLATLVELNAADAHYLRETAADVVRRVASSDWRAPVPTERDEFPRMPSGDTVRLEEITGQWTGPFAFFRPTGTLTLNVCSGTAGVVGSIEIDFGGRSPLRGPVHDFRVESGVLRFAFGADSVLRQEVRFSGTMVGDSLVGVAEFREEGALGASGWRVGHATDRESVGTVRCDSTPDRTEPPGAHSATVTLRRVTG